MKVVAMLGKRINELRERNRVSLEDLVAASGLDMKQVLDLESGLIARVDNKKLIKLAESLNPISLMDFGHLLNLNKVPLKLKIFRVGLLQTGSGSMVRMFSKDYRSANEFMINDSCEIIIKRIHNEISEEEFHTFIMERNYLAHLDIDSSYFMHHFTDVLTQEFTYSKVIFNIRDCYSWFSCMINFILNHRIRNNTLSGILYFGVSNYYITDKNNLMEKIPDLIDDMLSFWSNENNRILQSLPEGRSLVIRTHEISEKIDEIAAFAEIPVESLSRERTLSFPKEFNYNVMHELDYAFLKEKFDRHCTPLMERFFPGYTLKDFLQGNYLTNIKLYSNER